MCIIHLLLIQFFTHQFTSFRASNIYIFFFCFLVSRFLIVLPYLFYHSFFFLQNIFGCRLFFWIFFFFFLLFLLWICDSFCIVPQVFHFFHSCFSSKTRKTASDIINWWIVSSPLNCYQLTLFSSLECCQHHSSIDLCLFCLLLNI